MFFEDFRSPFLDQHFFVITSDGDFPDSSFYGYALEAGTIYFDNPGKRRLELTADGAWVNIIREGNKLLIQQDRFCSWGLYIFRQDDYFAIANNLFYLVRAVSRKYGLTLNMDFAGLLVSMPSGPLCLEETLINEIRQLPPHTEILIDMTTRKMETHEYTLRENYLSIFDRKAFNLIDRWHSRWNAILAHTASRHNVRVDISGGRDSRMAMSSLFQPDIDRGKFHFLCNFSEEYAADREIALKIASIYKFILNKEPAEEKFISVSRKQQFFTTLICRGSFSPLQGYYDYHSGRHFCLGGFGAESLRSYWRLPEEQVIDMLMHIRLAGSAHLYDRALRLMSTTMETLKKKYPNQEMMPAQILYTKIRNRNHFGKYFIESHVQNSALLAPMMDYDLARIKKKAQGNEDLDLLAAVIIDRYLPELVKVPFDSGHYIAEGTFRLAHELNIANPSQHTDYKVEIVEKRNKLAPSPAPEASPTRLREGIICAYRSEEFRSRITCLLGEEIYNKGVEFINTGNYWGQYFMNIVFPIMYINDIISNKKVVW